MVAAIREGLIVKTYLTEKKLSEFLTGICKLDEEISWGYCMALTEFTLDKLTSSASRAAMENTYIM